MGERSKKRGWLVCLPTAVVVLSALYIASFGPACWLVERELVTPQFAASLYAPLLWPIGDNLDPATNLLLMYGGKWCNDPGYALYLALLAQAAPITEEGEPWISEKRMPLNEVEQLERGH
jgi:hypothetical protein